MRTREIINDFICIIASMASMASMANIAQNVGELMVCQPTG